MKHIHLHFHFPPADGEVLSAITQLKEIVIMNNAEAAAAIAGVATNLSGLSTQLTAVNAQLQKATDEIVLAIQNAGNVSPDVQAAIENLQSASAALQAPAATAATMAQTLDDLHQDAPPPAP